MGRACRRRGPCGHDRPLPHGHPGLSPDGSGGGPPSDPPRPEAGPGPGGPVAPRSGPGHHPVRPDPRQSDRPGSGVRQECGGAAAHAAGRVRLRGVRHRHPLPARGQSPPPPVPADRGPGGDQPDGLQQCRARALRGPAAGPEAALVWPRRRQSGGQQGRHRPDRRLCHRPDPAVGRLRLFHRQHLVPQHPGSAGPAVPRRA